MVAWQISHERLNFTEFSRTTNGGEALVPPLSPLIILVEKTTVDRATDSITAICRLFRIMKSFFR